MEENGKEETKSAASTTSSNNGAAAGARAERSRSVMDYDSEEALRSALSTFPDGTSACTPSAEGRTAVDPALDWILPSFDPETTNVQSMEQELHRLQVLRSYLILDSEREEAFERITALASRIFKVPIALVSLVDLGRQWFMSNRGLETTARETPRKQAFCAHAIQAKHDKCLIVKDATTDDRFKDNELVTGPPHIRFYAGAPLMAPEGCKLGTFCIIDKEARPEGLTSEEKATLVDLANMTVKVMVDRRNQLERREDPAKLIAYTAHDLMTPLTGVQLSLSLLKDDHEVRAKLSPQQMELLSTATNCSDLMIRICERAIETLRKQQSAEKQGAGRVTDLLKSESTNGAGGGDAEVAVTKVVDLVKSLQMIMEPIPKHVPLIITLDPSVPETVASDDLKLFRSALNLLSNATGRTTSGKVHLKIFVRDDPPHLVFECEDTGEDMRVEEYQYLFQPSRTEKNALRLGLSSVASLVNSLGGKYGFRPRGINADGKKMLDKNGQQLRGSIFWFSVPMVAFDETESNSSGGRNRAGSANMPFVPLMYRSGSNNSVQSWSTFGFNLLSDSGRGESAMHHEGPTHNAVFDQHLPQQASIPSEIVGGAGVHAAGDEGDRKMPAVMLPPSLPVAVAAAAAAAAAPSSETAVGAVADGSNIGRTRMKRALVIEDSLVVRKSLARALNKLGFDVSQAVNGLEGLKSMKKTLFDMVLCDFLMPVMDGLDCVKQYRDWEKQFRPDFRQLIVGISAHVSVEDSGQGIEAGMDDFRPKPISIKTLTELQTSDAVVARTKLLDRMEGGGDQVSQAIVVDVAEDFSSAATAAAKRDQPAVPAADTRVDKRQKFDSTHSAPTTPVCLIAMETPTLASSEFLEVLETNGWKVSVVHDGADALRLLQSRNWDVVLVDDDIPNLPATKCIGEFREWEAKNRVNEQRNVFLCCDGDIPGPYDRSSIVQPPSGFNGVLRKPLEAAMIQKSSNKLKIVCRR